MRISGLEFFENFDTLFAERQRCAADPAALVRQFQDRTARTEFMKSFLDELASSFWTGRVRCEREFRSIDFCFWDTQDPWGKMKYRQPLYVLALIEHEGGPNPEEELWKLLHWYAPLKVLICYQPWPKLREYFNDLRGMVQDFLARSQEEQYLVIVGDIRNDGVGWRGWLTTSQDADFEELISPPAMKEQASTNQEWEKFTGDLALCLASLRDEQVLILSSECYYIQFANEGQSGMRAEAESNAYIEPGQVKLSTDAYAVMRQLGWNAPNLNMADSGNFFVDLVSPIDFRSLAELVVQTFRRVYNIHNPGELRYKSFIDCTDIQLPMLCLNREE